MAIKRNTLTKYAIAFVAGWLITLAFVVIAHAATPAPATLPTSITFTQGTTVRSLSLAHQKPGYTVTLSADVLRYTVGGSFVTFANSAGDVSVHWVFPAPPPVCPSKPADAQQAVFCDDGTHTWQQSHSWNPAPYPTCWTAQPWIPTTPPPGTCPVAPTGPLPQNQLVAISKPTTKAPFATQYATAEQRITDHAADHSACPWMKNDYSRRQPFNADGSRLLVYCGDGGVWLSYLLPAGTFEKVLNGPGGDDLDIQWSPTDPNQIFYIANDGGTQLNVLNVAANTHAVYWDFTAAVRAVFPTASRCMTKAEGSPSADNRLWGLECFTSSFGMLGYVVLDINAKTLVRSWPDTMQPDHVSITPSGRYLVPSNDDLTRGTQAYRVSDGTLACQLNKKSEHSDLGVGPNGDDVYVSLDYQLGEIFWTDVDTCTHHHVADIYNNPIFGPYYSFHISCKAFGRPSFCTMTPYNDDGSPANILLLNLATNAFTGIGVGMAKDLNYFDEVQGAISRDGHSIIFNQNFGTSLTGDVYRINF